MVKMVRTLLENRRFSAELSNKRSRWRLQRNGLPQGSVLATLLFLIYTSDQPIVPGTKSFAYVDDLAVAAQHKEFSEIEIIVSAALNNLTT